MSAFSCNNNSEEEDKNIKNDTLVYKTETKKNLRTPESVCYFSAGELFFVSNINGKPSEKEGNGFISKIDKSGKILNLKWIEGLNAPKGMAIYNNFLVVTDIDRIVVIDIEKSEIANIYNVDNAEFLNDVAVSSEGEFFISDMAANVVYKFKIGESPTIFAEKFLKSPNGLFYIEDFLFVGNNDFILKYNLSTDCFTKVYENTGSIDGLYGLSLQKFIVSDWTGNVHLIDSSGKKLLLSTEDKNINAADFEIYESEMLVFIPTFFDNRVMIYQLKN